MQSQPLSLSLNISRDNISSEHDKPLFTPMFNVVPVDSESKDTTLWLMKILIVQGGLGDGALLDEREGLTDVPKKTCQVIS
ncbi:hypothetical protein CY34DRAFT_479927 [Suillus luteus UH-Slu-Lm8-n1]|uniref:Uncharacterized protein n=1 Tax=Suillus luteus UH-Slu-Lm8-n1 TaxID=930992 RepID=A0A0D0AS25_9AGAM|nr:hypothetical protein CY34DRAFT_479927 [Suillus luteus UH-Slu-Lm8-n1]